MKRSWRWELSAPPERLWPLLADTARFNEAASFPRYTLEETPQPDGSVRRIARARVRGLSLAWEERPFEWVVNRYFRQTRRPLKGPIAAFTAMLELERSGTGGSRVTYTMEMEPRNAIGSLLLRLGVLEKAGQKVERLILQAGEFAAGRRATVYEVEPPRLPAGARERIATAVRQLEAAGHALAPRLAEFLLAAPEVDLARIRPRALARSWGEPDRPVIELCLAAGSAGLLALRWDLLCTRCRGAKVTVGSLDRVPQGAHCPSCNIEYGRDFTRNLEVTFRPAATIRAVAPGGFCLASPLATAHVQVQQILAPGESRLVDAALPPGEYRLRTLEPGDEITVRHNGGAFPSIRVRERVVETGPPETAGGGRQLALRNDGTTERTVVIEVRAWAAEALTAHEATTLQSFRDLFGAEALRPGDDVEIDQVTLMFTDLKGSTALYGRIGDARAYAAVREHYALLGAAIRANDGAIVKTIGDAVMAAFSEPAAAVRAALAVQREIAGFNAGSEAGPLIVKLGLHCGPCIAVTLNDRLDYFGSTVNLAARLQGQSEGGDIVISEALAADPTVTPLLAGLPLVAETAEVKGFSERARFWRLPATALKGKAAAAE